MAKALRVPQHFDAPFPISELDPTPLEPTPDKTDAPDEADGPALGSGAVERQRVVITLPPLAAEPRGYSPAHIDGHLTPQQAAKLKRLTEALQAAEVTVAVGHHHRREIRSSIDTLRWLLEQIEDENA